MQPNVYSSNQIEVCIHCIELIVNLIGVFEHLKFSKNLIICVRCFVSRAPDVEIQE